MNQRNIRFIREDYIIVGIIMIWGCSKAHHLGGGGEYM